MKTFDTFAEPDGWASAAAAFAEDFRSGERIQAAPWGGFAILGHAELITLSRMPAADGMAADPNMMSATPVLGRILDRALFTQSGPGHRSERAAMIAAFTSLSLDVLAQEIVGRVIEAAPTRADLRSDLIAPAVRDFWSALLGLSREEAAACASAIKDMGYMLSSNPVLEKADVAEAGAIRLNAFCESALRGPSSLVTTLKSHLGDARAVELLAGIAFDAVETTTVGIDAAMRVAFAHRDAARPTARAADECLRLASPVPLTMRYTTQAVKISGLVIEAGTPLSMVWAAGNHDPEAFPEPERYDAARVARPLSFGMGQHACLGHALTRTLLARLLGQLDGLHPLNAPLPELWQPHKGDGLRALPIEVRRNSAS